jgi:hypothetical protein
MYQSMKKFLSNLSFFCLFLVPIWAYAQQFKPNNNQITTQTFKTEVSRFLAEEITVSLKQLDKQGNVPPIILSGLPTGSDNDLPALLNTLGRYELLNDTALEQLLPIPDWKINAIYQVALQGATTFSQLFTAEYLWNKTNRKPWTGSEFAKQFTKEQQTAIINFLKVERFYDKEKKYVGGRPNNYFGVALLLEAYNVRLGFSEDKVLANDLMNYCVHLLDTNQGFLDDNLKQQGSFDRYHHEYLRFLWEAAELLDDQVALQHLTPYLKKSGQLWWDMFSPQMGIATPWGRSRQNSWDDSFEQTAFFANRPAISPASPQELATAFCVAYNYFFTYEYDVKAHHNKMLAEGKATWNYAGRNRIWQYSMGTLGKIARAAAEMIQALEKNNIQSFNAKLDLKNVAFFQFFRNKEHEKMGVWVVRDKNYCFTLPVVGNVALSDYSPVPFGLPQLDVPVQSSYPVLRPFVQINENQILTTQGAAQAITLQEEGKKIIITWNQMMSTQKKEPETTIQAVATWQWKDNALQYKLELIAEKEVKIQQFQFDIPSTLSNYFPEKRTFTDKNLNLAVKQLKSSTQKIKTKLRGATNEALFKGAFYPIPLMLSVTEENIVINKGKNYVFQTTLGL